MSCVLGEEVEFDPRMNLVIKRDSLYFVREPLETGSMKRADSSGLEGSRFKYCLRDSTGHRGSGRSCESRSAFICIGSKRLDGSSFLARNKGSERRIIRSEEPPDSRLSRVREWSSEMRPPSARANKNAVFAARSDGEIGNGSNVVNLRASFKFQEICFCGADGLLSLKDLRSNAKWSESRFKPKIGLRTDLSADL